VIQLVRLFALCLAIVAIAACSQESPVAPAMRAAACGYTVSPAEAKTSVAGSTFQVCVSVASGADSGCQWTVSTSDPWIHHVTTATAQAAGDFTMAVDAIPWYSGGRHGTATVSWPGGSQSIDVMQGCSVTHSENLSPERQVYTLSTTFPICFGFDPGFSVDVPWIHAAGTHRDQSQMDFLVDGNTSLERTGHVVASWGQLTIVQGAGNCITAIAPAGQTFDENGGAGTITVTGVPGCEWDAIVHDVSGYSTITPYTAHGSGSGVVSFNLSRNASAFVRSPYFLVGGTLRFQITQSARQTTASALVPQTRSSSEHHLPAPLRVNR
jgi:hypothetical protein